MVFNEDAGFGEGWRRAACFGAPLATHQLRHNYARDGAAPNTGRHLIDSGGIFLRNPVALRDNVCNNDIMKRPLEPIYRQFGSKIESLRMSLGITQMELARRVGLTRPSIANIESGNQRILLADVERFAEAFGTSPKFLMRGIWL